MGWAHLICEQLHEQRVRLAAVDDVGGAHPLGQRPDAAVHLRTRGAGRAGEQRQGFGAGRARPWRGAAASGAEAGRGRQARAMTPGSLPNPAQSSAYQQPSTTQPSPRQRSPALLRCALGIMPPAITPSSTSSLQSRIDSAANLVDTSSCLWVGRAQRCRGVRAEAVQDAKAADVFLVVRDTHSWFSSCEIRGICTDGGQGCGVRARHNDASRQLGARRGCVRGAPCAARKAGTAAYQPKRHTLSRMTPGTSVIRMSFSAFSDAAICRQQSANQRERVFCKERVRSVPARQLLLLSPRLPPPPLPCRTPAPRHGGRTSPAAVSALTFRPWP